MRVRVNKGDILYIDEEDVFPGVRCLRMEIKKNGTFIDIGTLEANKPKSKWKVLKIKITPKGDIKVLPEKVS